MRRTLRTIAAAIVVALVVAVLVGRIAAARQERIRETLFAELQPVPLVNCRFERFGEPHDGGYALCANLLDSAASAYSYGISGYDGWGCDVSRALGVQVHEYDCFDLRRPACPGGRAVFHAECVGPARSVDADGRVFASVADQIDANRDTGRHLVVKMDVEGAEWDSLPSVPDAVLQRIDQLVVEFHTAPEPPRHALVRRLRLDRPATPSTRMFEQRDLDVIRRLERFFLVAHVHFNNFSCDTSIRPFPSWAYEVLFVNKAIGVVGEPPPDQAAAPDAPNNPGAADCQAAFPASAAARSRRTGGS